MSNTTVEETTKEKTQYYKRIDDLIDDAEIEAEIEAEQKIRSKNTKLLTISFVAVAVVAFLYFGMETSKQTSVPPVEEKFPEVAQNPVTESLPETTTSSETPPVESSTTKPDTTEPVVSTPPTKSKPPVKEISPVVEIAKAEPAKPIKPTPPPAPIKRTPAPAAPKIASGNIFIQTGAFSVRENAERMAKRLKAKGFKSSIVSNSKLVTRHVVYLSGYPDLASLSAPIKSLKKAGITNYDQRKNDNGTYSLYLTDFKTTEEAGKYRDKLSLNGILAEEKVEDVILLTHFAQVGGYATRKDAIKIKKKLDSAGIKGSFIR